MLKETNKIKNQDLTFSPLKKWLKHFSLITSFFVVLFLALIILREDIFSLAIIGNLKVSNIFLLAFFILFTMLSVLFTNKVRRDNLFTEKHINFGLYIFLTGIMIVNALLLYISLEDYSIFSILNPYILLFTGIMLVFSGLYINYTYLDENIYNMIISNRIYSTRILASILFILLYSLFNFYFGFYFLLLVIIFWIDIIILEIFIPITINTTKTIFYIGKTSLFFLISLPGLIITFFSNATRKTVSFFVNLLKSTFNKSKTLNTNLHYSKKDIITSILFSFGLSILVLQSFPILFLITGFQMLLSYYFISDLNQLSKLYEQFDSELYVSRKSFYQLYNMYLIILMIILEPISYTIQSIYSIDSTELLSVAIISILLSCAIILYKPLLSIAILVKRGIQSFLFEVYSLISFDKLSALRISFTSLGLIVMSFAIDNSVQLFFSIFLFFIFLFLSTRLDIKPIVRIYKKTSELTNDNLKEKLSLKVKLYLLSIITLILFLPSSLIFAGRTDITSSIYTFYFSIILIIAPNLLALLAVSYVVLKILLVYLERLLSYIKHIFTSFLSFIKFNFYTKIHFTIKINIEYAIFQKAEIVRLCLNGVILALLIQLLLPEFFTNIFLLVFMNLLLIILFFASLNSYYNTLDSLFNTIEESSARDSPNSIFQKVKNFIFNSEENNKERMKNYLRINKINARAILIFPSIILASLLFNVLAGYLIPNNFLFLAILVVILGILNILPILAFIKMTILVLFNILQSIVISMFNISKSIVLSFIVIIQAFYSILLQAANKIYFILFKNGNKTLSLDLALILVTYFFIGNLFIDQMGQLAVLVDLGVILLVYVVGLVLIWHQIILLYLSLLGNYMVSTLYSYLRSVYNVLFSHGQYSYSLDSFIIFFILYILTILSFGVDNNRSLAFIGIFVLSLVVIWINQIITTISKVVISLGLIVKKAWTFTTEAFARIMISLKFFIMESINYSLFYISILFSGIFILFGIIYVISGILNDSGAFIKTIFFDINLLFGLAGITNIILVLLGGGLIFAGLLLVRILNENKERLLLHVYTIHRKEKVLR